MFEQALIKLCGSGYSRGWFFVVAMIKVESEADRKHGFYLVAGGRGLKCSSTCNQRGLVEMPSATHGQNEFLELQAAKHCHSTLPFRRLFTDTKPLLLWAIDFLFKTNVVMVSRKVIFGRFIQDEHCVAPISRAFALW